MARPTLLEQITKAGLDGDIEKVKELSAKLMEQNALAKKKEKAAAKKAKTPKRVKVQKVSREEFVESVEQEEDEIFFAINQNTANLNTGIVDKNRKNLFDKIKGNFEDIGEVQRAGEDDLINSSKMRPVRPRPTAKKINVTCSKCAKTKNIYPDEYGNRSVDMKPWMCDECVKGYIPRGR